MFKLTLLCDHDITKKPRSSRMLQMLCGSRDKTLEFKINVIAKACENLESIPHISKNIKLFSFPADKTSKRRSHRENMLIQERCQKGDFESLIYISTRSYIKSFLDSLPIQDLLIVEDITLLPFACDYKRHFPSCQILIDLREFYPLEYENDCQWLLGLGRLFKHLCETYLPYVDLALSVSEGLCERYRYDYGIECEVFYSLPPYYPLSPHFTPKTNIKILYHGFISPDRSSFELLDLGRKLLELGNTYKLFVMALSNQKGFLESFCDQAQEIPTLEVLPPIKMQDIIPFSASFDIGLIPFKPTTFNLSHCMPNKFFEYLQARLCIVSTPLEDISKFLKQYSFGVCSNGSEVDCIFQTLSNLSPSLIDTFKMHAHQNALQWSMLSNQDRILHIIQNLLKK